MHRDAPTRGAVGVEPVVVSTLTLRNAPAGWEV